MYTSTRAAFSMYNVCINLKSKKQKKKQFFKNCAIGTLQYYDKR